VFHKSNNPKIVAVACGALAVLGLAAPSAMASPASSVNRTEDAPGRFTLHVDAQPGVANVLRLTHENGYISVGDGGPGGPVAAGGGCNDVGSTPPLVACPDTGVEVQFAKLGDQNDTATNAGDMQAYVYGEDGADRLTGGSIYDFLNGGPGNDVLDGQGGGDALVAGPGDDQLLGRDGNDQLYGAEGIDTLDGGAGADELLWSPGPDDIHGGTDPGPVVAPHQAGVVGGDIGGVREPESTDTVTYQFEKQPLSISLDDNANDGEAGEGDNVHSDIERVIGGDVDDRIEGNGRPNTIDGLFGDDKLFGYGGGDTLYGDQGQDEIRGGEGSDRLDGGSGDDLVVGEPGNDLLIGGPGADTMRGGDGVDTVTYATGQPVPVSVTFDGAANDGAATEADNVGVDVENAVGGPGNDELKGDERANALSGGAGNDAISGGEAADVLDGGEGDDTITSRDGASDTVTCGAGNDTVIADTSDKVAADCENVQLPATDTPGTGTGTGTGTTGTGTGTTGTGTGGATVSGTGERGGAGGAGTTCSTIRVAGGRVKRGRASISLTLAGGATAPCRARVTLTAGPKLGTARAKLVPGKTVVARVKLGGAARKRLAGRRSARVTVTVVTVDAAGRVATARGRVQLRR
jgi:Ca2+-binding RTX toxin-like protein